MAKKDIQEFRKDLVSGDWILIAPLRKKRPDFVKKPSASKLPVGIEGCPFENPQKSGNPHPLLWYPRPDTPASQKENLDFWFVQVVPNKYPLLSHQETCPEIQNKKEVEFTLRAVGYHEVVITRDHFRPFEKMTVEEVELVLRVYKERMHVLMKDPCVKYILIFHNQGEAAGASIWHPHSQLVALPIVDPDITSSLNGSLNFYKVYKKCVHCTMIEHEMKERARVVYKNKHFVTVVPYAPRVSYETRLYPLKHASRFDMISEEERMAMADSLKDAMERLDKVLDSPDYNFFIHSAPVGGQSDFEHYHWHLEIFPRGFKWAGLELGTGIEIVVVPPEEAAAHLKKAK